MSDETNLIEQYADMPAMPNIMIRALKTMKDDAAGVKELADIMSYDQALVTQVLKLVNSAYYGFAQQTTSILKALSLLGMTQAKNIITAVAMKPMLTSMGGKDLWKHCMKVAVSCEYVARKFKVMDPQEAFIIGFLHDIGKMILNKKNPALYYRVNSLAQNGVDIIEAETTFFGTNHAHLGFLLSKKWKLPVVIMNSIKYHHTPQLSSMPNISSLVYVSDRLVQDKIPKPFFSTAALSKCSFEVDNPMEYREEILFESERLISELSL